MYSIHSIITARNFGILNFHLLNTTISLFKIANCVQIQYFTFEQVRKLFCEFVHGHHTLIEDAVILIDGPNWMGAFSICLIVLWELKVFHSYPALVCLCECIISQNWQLLHKSNLGSISYWKSQQFPENKLYNNSDITHWHSSQSIWSCQCCKQSNFLWFLDEVELSDHDEWNLADSLTAEGALFKKDSVRSIYHMYLPLLNGLIQNNLIPRLFLNYPMLVPSQGVGEKPWCFRNSSI